MGTEEAWRTAAKRLPFWVRLPDQSTTPNRSSLPAVAAAMVMHATGRCESEGLDSPGQYKGGVLVGWVHKQTTVANLHSP